MDAQTLWTEIRRGFRRLLVSDFQTEHATDAERARLAVAPVPVAQPMVQDYAAWRRSLLWIAGVALVCLALFEFATFRSREENIRREADKLIEGARERGGFQAEQEIAQVRENVANVIQVLGPQNLETLDGIVTFLIIPVLVGGILALVAAHRWADVRVSRRLARLGFLIMFVTPFTLAALPVKEMLEFGHLPEAARKQVSMLIGFDMGMVFFLLIGPRAIALFPGVIRSSMTLKTLIPESPMTGWAAALVAPLYSIFLLVVFALVNQAYGNLLLLAGLLCLMVSPLIYIWKGRDVLRPHRTDEVSSVVGRIRRQAALFNLAGSVLIGIFLIDLEVFGFDAFLKFFVSVIGNVVLLTVVGADFLLALLRAGHLQSRALIESQLEAPLEARFDALAAVGLGQIRAGETTARPSSPPR